MDDCYLKEYENSIKFSSVPKLIIGSEKLSKALFILYNYFDKVCI